ncbi:hypothetical protein HanRHA438_Chr09g0377781 [Helianthus annuus]|uniref:Uncharacterized protein n=1 Tax=Helianthus annuus TaxID=4232 RepID=A0A9K3I2A8_HELAN|nr:hypothetical protein HanXRQr2_Chr09g0366681 [Helianthus annuus]KAJ0540832.1 hypothetical protein HanHA89_Chr09g0321301 [Helianthus annuus]KAJ0705920.1 hypothetical protein HanLR1_Chr09g0300921 [Helianthus annuus]KAJ0886305.1 hypothetical protein HanRHA438_Chr09g0377781 [Helianthus annuus]
MAEKVIFYLYARGYLKARSLKHHLTVAATEKDEKYIYKLIELRVRPSPNAYLVWVLHANDKLLWMG